MHTLQIIIGDTKQINGYLVIKQNCVTTKKT
jgi:hypothetical protein